VSVGFESKCFNLSNTLSALLNQLSLKRQKVLPETLIIRVGFQVSGA
jgi:hypothetical protein